MTPDPGLEDSLFGVVLQDSYRIVGLLGEGGMGAVYDALQVRLNKRVAIKVMARSLATNTEALNRFHREAMITSGLGHPHIVQVFDFSTTPGGQPFLAMEFLEGEDLDRRLARIGHLSPEQTVHIVKQVASALSATHAQQIVHRDLKPANIYLLKVAGEEDFVKVLDFGISKIRAANTKITKASALIGTPDYMSPEQAMGGSDDVDDRTDQWALACIAWECLSGKAPFTADTVPAMLFRVVHQEPPPLAPKVGSLPDGVEAVLRRALAKNKEERFPNVVDFAQALESAIQGRAVPAQQVEPEVTAKVRTETATYESEDKERGERPATTFSRAAGEATANQPRPVRPKWHWAIAGVGVAALSLAVVLVLRPAAQRRHAASEPPAAQAPSAVPVAAPALPAPTAAPPPAAAPNPAGEPTATAPAPGAAPAPAAVPTPTGEPAAPAQAVTAPAGRPTGAAEPPSATAAPEEPAAPAEHEAKAGSRDSDQKRHASEAEGKPRAKKTTPGGRARTKSLLPEHRLIKEL